MTALNKTLAGKHLPQRIKELPRDHRGFPIPAFVYRDRAGTPDFRVIEPRYIARAVTKKLCWVCGHKLARHRAFVIGPMCTVNRISGEPPCHRSCAMFAAVGCPFLTQPRMRRNEVNLPPEGYTLDGGLAHNPGVTAVWIARSYEVIAVDNGVLFKIGEPEEVRWLTEGRAASRNEVLAAIQKGLPHLMKIAREEGQASIDALIEQVKIAGQYLPPKTEDDHAAQRQAAAEGQAVSGGDVQAAHAAAAGDVR